MFCTKCGSPNYDNAEVCKSCASPFARANKADASPSDNAFGKLCKWGIVLWTLFCLFGVFSGMANVAEQNKGNIGTATAIGATIGLGIWAFAWFVPTTGAAVLYLPFWSQAGGGTSISASDCLGSTDNRLPVVKRPFAKKSRLLTEMIPTGLLIQTDKTATPSCSSTVMINSRDLI
jgi:hypothetical protein